MSDPSGGTVAGSGFGAAAGNGMFGNSQISQPDWHNTIVADSVYVNGYCVARQVAVTLPAITPINAEVNAMGKMNLPVLGLLEIMEAKIAFVGGMQNVLTDVLNPAGWNAIEIRWVQNVVKPGGGSTNTGYRA